MTPTEKYLTFEVLQKPFGISTQQIREVIPCATVSLVPDAPDFILGIMNHRDEVMPVVDIEVLFGGSPTVLDEQSCFIIAQVGSGQASASVAFAVHRIKAAYRVTPEEMDAPPVIGGHTRADYIHGLARIGDLLCVILNLEKLCAPHRTQLAHIVEPENDLNAAAELDAPMSHDTAGREAA